MRRKFAKGEVRIKIRRPSIKSFVNSSKDGDRLIRSQWHKRLFKGDGYIYLICLDKENNVVCCERVSSRGCLIDIEMVVVLAVSCKSRKIVIGRNCISLEPTEDDKKIIEIIQSAMKPLKIELLDHLILTKKGYYSSGDSGVLDFAPLV